MPVLIALLLIALLTLVSGVLLIRHGRRGYAIDDHPICRRCGFDLIGLPADSDRCSECGADLRQPGAIVRGRRVQLMGKILGGSLLIVLAVALVGLPIHVGIRQAGFTQYKPIWWLLRETRAADLQARNSALSELQRRARIPKFSHSSFSAIADAGLEEQKSAARWDQRWGDLIALARERNALDDERWQRYLHQAVRNVTLRARPLVRRGDPVPYRIEYDCRLGSSGMQAVLTHSASLDRPPIATDPSFGNIIKTYSPGAWPGLLTIDRNAPEGVLLGEHDLHVCLRVRLDNTASPATQFDVTLPLSAKFSIASENEHLVTPIEPEESEVAVQIPISAKLRVASDGNRTFDIKAGPAQYPIAFEVFASDGTREWRITTIALPANDVMSYWAPLPRELAAPRVDLIFRPSADVARRTVTLTQYWNGTIEVKDVPIARDQ